MTVWLTSQQVSANTGIAVKTLANWRSLSTPESPVGPSFLKVGRLVRYAAADVEAWQQSLTKAAAS